MTRPLNVTGKQFCNAVGIAYSNDILKELRSLNLVGFFKVGKKYLYPFEDVKKISDSLRRGEISIKTDNGYYLTINKKPPSSKGGQFKF